MAWRFLSEQHGHRAARAGADVELAQRSEADAGQGVCGVHALDCERFGQVHA